MGSVLPNGAAPSDFEKPQAAASECAPIAGEPLGPGEGSEDEGWREFRDQCRRQMQRPLDQRIKYGFCRMYKPVLDDAPWRSFETMEEYRTWCAARLPGYLGFRLAKS